MLITHHSVDPCYSILIQWYIDQHLQCVINIDQPSKNFDQLRLTLINQKCLQCGVYQENAKNSLDAEGTHHYNVLFCFSGPAYSSSHCNLALVITLHGPVKHNEQVKELSFFTGRGGAFVCDRQPSFFSAPPFRYPKFLGPLWVPEKFLPSPLAHKSGSPSNCGQTHVSLWAATQSWHICVPQIILPPLPCKNW